MDPGKGVRVGVRQWGGEVNGDKGSGREEKGGRERGTERREG